MALRAGLLSGSGNMVDGYGAQQAHRPTMYHLERRVQLSLLIAAELGNSIIVTVGAGALVEVYRAAMAGYA